MTQPTIAIYSTPTCHFCHMAKDYFDAHGLKYEDYNVAVDTEKRKEMVEKTGQMGVPVIVIGDQVIIGFDEGRIHTILP